MTVCTRRVQATLFLQGWIQVRRIVKPSRSKCFAGILKRPETNLELRGKVRKRRSLQVERAQPDTPRKPVSDTYFGQIVSDDYRWLEESKDPSVKKWVADQNKFARSYLDKTDFRLSIHARLKELYGKTSAIYSSLTFKGDRLFFIKWHPSKQQPFLVALKSIQGEETTVFDPNDYDKSFSTSIDFYVPSLDGKLVAICLSKNGSEDGSVHVFEIEQGAMLEDIVPRVNYPTAGGSVAWTEDSQGFYYTRYPYEGERPKEDVNFYQQVYFHRLGTKPEKDAYVIGKEFPRIAEIKLESSDDGTKFLATVANGDGGEFSHYYLAPSKTWTKITKFEDKITRASFSRDGQSLFMLSRKSSKGTIVLLPLEDRPKLEEAKTLVGPREGSIQGFEVTKSKLYVVEVVGGPSKMFVYETDGRFVKEVPIEPVSSIDEVSGLDADRVLVKTESFVRPPAWYEFDSVADSMKWTPFVTPSPVDLSDLEVVREFAMSKDGTRVPMSIVRKRGTKRDGTTPTLLYAYGGYGISMSPSFQIRTAVWLEQGFVYAVANIRGGGEYGEDWHKAGMLTNKQNVFDDFIACAKYLIEVGYTNPKKLVIEGGSNGGLLMGAALTQHPEMFQAVVSHVGIYDMLRVELDDNGAFNVTEFGTVKDPSQFRALYLYSPYHKVIDGGRYPATLIMTGENDGRVNPAHSRKMTARLQRGTISGRPVLLRTDAAGHGFGTALDERIAQAADVFAFLFDQLGVMYRTHNGEAPEIVK
jgi:prolyl oligopeptidase